MKSGTASSLTSESTTPGQAACNLLDRFDAAGGWVSEFHRLDIHLNMKININIFEQAMVDLQQWPLVPAPWTE